MQQLLGAVKTEYSDTIHDLKESWSGGTCSFSFNAMGFRVSGGIHITPSEVTVTGDLPFAAFLFKDTIESIIRQRASALLR